MSSLRYWVWLSALGAVSAKGRAAVIRRFGDAESAFFSPSGSFEGTDGLSETEIAALERRELSCADEVIAACREQGLGILTMQDAAYPARLRGIYAPPVVLYVKGELPPIDDEAAVAVIGTRRASVYGMRMGRQIAYEIARSGGLVVSGLTTGVDAAAASGAMAAGGICVGVLGTAHELQDGEFAASVADKGALISEYPPGTRPLKSHFRERNRISSGISLGVVAVEAPEKSGTLLFVAEALDQGREIFAVPGNADAPGCRGTNKLLKDGAKPVTCGWDVMCEFAPLFPGRLKEPETDRPAQPPEPAAEEKKEIDNKKGTGYIDLREYLSTLNETQLKIVAAIDREATHIDDVVEKTGLGAATVLTQLTLLTVKGVVKRVPGNRVALDIEHISAKK